MSLSDTNPHVRRAIEAFNDHDLDGVMAEFAEDATFNDPLLDEPAVGEEVRAYTADVLQGFPDVRLEIERVFETDGAYALEGTYVGTHDGPMEGIPPTGNDVAVPTMTVIDASDEGITAWRDYWDGQAFADQLGLTFPSILTLLPGMAVGKLRELV